MATQRINNIYRRRSASWGYLLCLCVTFSEVELSVTSSLQSDPIKEFRDCDIARYHSNYTQLPICNLTVNYRDAKNFLRLIFRKRANFADFFLKIPDTVSVKCTDNVFLPFVWFWTSKTQYGAEPYLKFDYDAGRLSLGLLDFFTLRRVPLRLDSQPDNCSLEFGAHDTNRAIGRALGNMVLDYFPESMEIQRNFSVFCHIVKLDPFADGEPLFYFYTYFGYWKDLTAYVCCEFYRNYVTDQLKITCKRKPVKLTDWSLVFYIIGLICFLYLPIPLALLCDYTSVSTSTDPAEFREVTTVTDLDYSVNEETPLLRERSWSGNQAKREEEWMYLGLDKPATVMSLIGGSIRCLVQKFPIIVSRLQRLVFFAVLIPLPLYIKVIYYYLKSPLSTPHRIKAGIPVGFLSIPYGFSASAGNWLTIFGGPIVFLGVYLTVGQIFVCAPKNISKFLLTALRRDSGEPKTLLSLDLSSIERFGSVELNQDNPDVLVFNLLKGNLYTVLNPLFWKSAKHFWYDRFIKRIIPERKPKVNICALVLLYSVLCLIEATFCIFYYGCPTVFYCTNLVKATLRKITGNYCKRFCLSSFVALVLLFNYYAFFLIFIRGIYFLLLIVDYTYIGIVVYPSTALGYVIGVSTLLVYIGRSTRKLLDSYLILFDEVVKICQALENANEENTVTIRDNSLVVRHVDGSAIRTLEMGGIRVNFTREQCQMLMLSNSGGNNRGTNSKYIRWHGVYPGIRSKLYYYIVEKHHPLRGAVFVFLVELSAFMVLVISVVSLIIDFNRVSTFTLPAQVVTAIALTVIPKLNEFFTSHKERDIQHRIIRSKLKISVKRFFEKQEEAPLGQNSWRLRSVV